jgi:hypothetical protein
LFTILFGPEDEEDTFFRNVVGILPKYTAL